jgi:hypothetical protein
MRPCSSAIMALIELRAGEPGYAIERFSEAGGSGNVSSVAANQYRAKRRYADSYFRTAEVSPQTLSGSSPGIVQSHVGVTTPIPAGWDTIPAGWIGSEGSRVTGYLFPARH